MSKVNLNNLVNLENQTSAVNIINNNNDAIETFSNDVLSRTGKTPNTMESQLDMNSNHLINLPEPTVGTEPVRLQDLETIIDPEQTGNVTSIASDTAGGEATIFSGSTGKIISKYANTGLVKANAGVLDNAVQGTDYWAPGGTDVDIADGGTGASTALGAFDNLKQPATTSYVGAVQLATGAEAITGTDPDKALTPATFSSAYNAAIPNSLAPYSKIIRTTSAAPSSSAYTLALTDQGNVVIPNGSGALTITVPTNASVAFTAGCQIDFIQNGAGKVTFAAASGVTLLSSNSLRSMNGLYSSCTLYYAGGDFWWLFGNLAP